MDKILLHSCCAPCSVYCVDTLRGEGIEPVSLWFNPNIHPWTEYDQRRSTLLEYGEKERVEVHILEDYGLRDFVRAVAADIDHRCAHCYTIRLGTAAKYASEHGYEAFTSSLLISPYQNHELLKAVGETMAPCSRASRRITSTQTPTAPARERRCRSEPNSRRSAHEVERHSDGYAFG